MQLFLKPHWNLDKTLSKSCLLRNLSNNLESTGRMLTHTYFLCYVNCFWKLEWCLLISNNLGNLFLFKESLKYLKITSAKKITIFFNYFSWIIAILDCFRGIQRCYFFELIFLGKKTKRKVSHIFMLWFHWKKNAWLVPLINNSHQNRMVIILWEGIIVFIV